MDIDEILFGKCYLFSLSLSHSLSLTLFFFFFTLLMNDFFVIFSMFCVTNGVLYPNFLSFVWILVEQPIL